MEFEELEAYPPAVKFAALKKWEDMINFLKSSFFCFLTHEDELIFANAIQKTSELKETYTNVSLENEICNILDHLNLLDVDKEAVEEGSRLNISPETRLGELSAIQKMVEIIKECLSWTFQPEDAKLLDETIKQIEAEKRVCSAMLLQIKT